jgi:hypothetical protein
MCDGRRGEAISVSMRSTEPSSLYILIQLRSMRCFTRRSGRRQAAQRSRAGRRRDRLEFAVELAAENVITFCQLDEIELDVVRCRRLIVRQNEYG